MHELIRFVFAMSCLDQFLVTDERFYVWKNSAQWAMKCDFVFLLTYVCMWFFLITDLLGIMLNMKVGWLIWKCLRFTWTWNKEGIWWYRSKNFLDEYHIFSGGCIYSLYISYYFGYHFLTNFDTILFMYMYVPNVFNCNMSHIN